MGIWGSCLKIVIMLQTCSSLPRTALYRIMEKCLLNKQLGEVFSVNHDGSAVLDVSTL